MTVTVTLDWRDICTAAVSIVLLLSFWLALRSREVAKDNERGSLIRFAWSGVLLFVGHAVLFVVAAFVSLEGLWIVNLGFMLFGASAVLRMALGLRRLRRAPAAAPAPVLTESPAVHADTPPPTQVPLTPAPLAAPGTNGHQLPVQRPAPSGSGPRPRPAFGPGVAALEAEPTRTESLIPRKPQDRRHTPSVHASTSEGH